MANLQELSSSTSLNASSCISSNSSESTNSLEVVSLNKLSSNLSSLLTEPDQFAFADVEIEVQGSVIGIHRCILAARSTFFYEKFKERGSSGMVKQKYLMEDLMPFGYVGCDVFKEFLWYLYTGKLRQPDPDISTCMDEDCPHDACRPAINFVVEMMYASHRFKIVELVSLLQRRLLDFINKAFVEDVIPILLVALYAEQNQLIELCSHRIAYSDLDDITLMKELPLDLYEKIKSLRFPSPMVAPASSIHVKGVKRIQRALVTDDIELVKMLLEESDITLDDANALHYAAAYCDSKIVADVLELGMSKGNLDINLKNERGNTPLHVAAMRMEPDVIMELIRKGALVLTSMNDGRNAVKICRRLTRPKDYNAIRNEGEESNKSRICIDVLERELQIPMEREESVESTSSPEDLQMHFIDLDTRVAFAQAFFPAEAKLAMKIAETESRKLDLNETPSQQLQASINRLEKTVQLGRRYFPHCSKWLDNFFDGNLLELTNDEVTGQLELKRRRYHEIKEDILKAFSKDMARKDHKYVRSPIGQSSSSSSSPSKGEQEAELDNKEVISLKEISRLNFHVRISLKISLIPKMRTRHFNGSSNDIIAKGAFEYLVDNVYDALPWSHHLFIYFAHEPLISLR